MNWRTYLILFGLLLLAVTGLQFTMNPARTPQHARSTDGGTQQLPDLVIESPVMQHFDETGRMAWEVKGTALRHHEHIDQSEVDQPVALIRPKDDKPQAGTVADQPLGNNPWHLQANMAHLTEGNTRILLQGDAKVSNQDLEIDSEQIDMDTNRQFATTDKAVTIHARGSTAHAAGLQADLTNKTLRLPAQVKEIHEPPKRKP